MADEPAYAAIAGAALSAPRPTRRVTIGHDVWFGANTVVRSGVSIGDGAVIAAGAVVSRNVAPFAVVGGVPARVLRYRFPAEMIRRLRELRWWDYDLGAVRDAIDYSDLERATAMLESMKARGELQRAEERFVQFQNRETRRTPVASVHFDSVRSHLKWAAGKLRGALQGLRV
jgi:acyl-[acyl carrier protein]--UDP-N-acetylglucosamine O-acyltransferase